MTKEELPDRFFLKKDRTRRLSVALNELTKDLALDKAFKNRKLLGLWQEIVGEEVSSYTRIVGLKRGYLYVEVDSTAQLHHLSSFYKEDILKELQTRYKNTYVTNIKFKLSTDNKNKNRKTLETGH